MDANPGQLIAITKPFKFCGLVRVALPCRVQTGVRLDELRLAKRQTYLGCALNWLAKSIPAVCSGLLIAGAAPLDLFAEDAIHQSSVIFGNVFSENELREDRIEELPRFGTQLDDTETTSGQVKLRDGAVVQIQSGSESTTTTSPASKQAIPIPSNRMTVRLNPSPQQKVRNADETGKTLRSVQQELHGGETGQLPSIPVSSRFTETNWSLELPYGKYLYIHHEPLLFEDIPVERYGEECHHCLQPVISFTKFMGTVPLLPYKITTDYFAARHEDGVYSFDYQGNMRPGILDGSYFPTLETIRTYPRSNLAGLFAEGTIVTGIYFALP